MNELIDALRWCGSEDERHEMCVDESYRCPMWNEDRITDECKAELMRDAADALEQLQAQVPAWISVEERLPELTEQIETYDYCVDYSKDVLIWSPMNMVPLFEIARYTDGMGWTDPYFRRIKFQETITHWMPLPKAPDLT